jgi:hypothetical protein
MYHLVVRSAFDGHRKGDLITEPLIVAAILADPHKAGSVVKVAAPDNAPVVTEPQA